jgi:hypothetical protein
MHIYSSPIGVLADRLPTIGDFHQSLAERACTTQLFFLINDVVKSVSMSPSLLSYDLSSFSKYRWSSLISDRENMSGLQGTLTELQSLRPLSNLTTRWLQSLEQHWTMTKAECVAIGLRTFRLTGARCNINCFAISSTSLVFNCMTSFPY